MLYTRYNNGVFEIAYANTCSSRSLWLYSPIKYTMTSIGNDFLPLCSRVMGILPLVLIEVHEYNKVHIVYVNKQSLTTIQNRIIITENN